MRATTSSATCSICLRGGLLRQSQHFKLALTAALDGQSPNSGLRQQSSSSDLDEADWLSCVVLFLYVRVALRLLFFVLGSRVHGET